MSIEKDAYLYVFQDKIREYRIKIPIDPKLWPYRVYAKDEFGRYSYRLMPGIEGAPYNRALWLSESNPIKAADIFYRNLKEMVDKEECRLEKHKQELEILEKQIAKGERGNGTETEY